jgi:hypothetical protein
LQSPELELIWIVSCKASSLLLHLLLLLHHWVASTHHWIRICIEIEGLLIHELLLRWLLHHNTIPELLLL